MRGCVDGKGLGMMGCGENASLRGDLRGWVEYLREWRG